jgi:hypothetical protein
MGAHENWVLGTVFSVDGKRVVSVGRDGAAKLTDSGSGAFQENVNLLRGPLAAVARHPARDIVVIGGEDRVAYVYLMDRPKNMKIADDTTLIRKLERQNGVIAALAWSPDGSRIAVAGAAPEVNVYDADTGARVAACAGHSAGIYSVAFSPDSATLATGGFDGTVRLYDAATGILKKSFVPVPLEKPYRSREGRDDSVHNHAGPGRPVRDGRRTGDHGIAAARRRDWPSFHFDRNRPQHRGRRPRDLDPAGIVYPGAADTNAGDDDTAGRSVSFLVEPRADVAPGVYPIRIESAGISNVLLFTLGTYPEVTEEESQPDSLPNRNDTIETAEPVRSAPVVVNGTLRGPERDVYRVQGKAGERRVFELEARRCGSAIDPVLRILDGAGKQLARSDDAPGANLDARLDFTFPSDGNYYVEVTDARFSTQTQNFYRLKMGAYRYADGIFPLGGRRGERVPVTFYGGNLGGG